MEQIILNIVAALRRGEAVDDRALVKLVNAEARRSAQDKSCFAKRRLLPFYQRVKREEPERWASWNITPELEEGLLACLRMKPRRSASGVATITVITKPWPCRGDCLFCPSDVRMPKSYLHAEPACARAEQNCFDPYLQVATRLQALSQMGHATDKIELIILGGTWSDYPQPYQIWFVRELFRALNEGISPDGVAARRTWYERRGISCREDDLAAAARDAQARVNAGDLSYNRAHLELYGAGSAWAALAADQVADMAELEREQRINETARHRVVGLVIETRPDAVTLGALHLIRRLGCTKVQMGVQSTRQEILDENGRGIRLEEIERAFDLLRAFGFKIHAHAMANLVGATPESDKLDYARLMEARAFRPDEVKLYPCALIESARLRRVFEAGGWRPYTEDELLDVLVDDVLATPAFCRISRMIRDFSSDDIMVGNKKPNLRQLVERRIVARAGAAGVHPDVAEIRFREVGTRSLDRDALSMDDVSYETANTREHFLQWVAPSGVIAGFLRLSLPDAGYISQREAELPVGVGEAMIREVHVYGMATPIAEEGHAAQHRGLGTQLIERACAIARAAGYTSVNVISAVGTRGYYRRLGFLDHGLYQQRPLSDEEV